LLATAAFAVAGVLGSTETLAQNAYIANTYSNTVSVIDVATNTVRATISGFDDPQGVAVSPDGRKVYVGNYGVGTAGSMAVIDTATNAVTTITDASFGGPVGIEVDPDCETTGAAC